jgi:hypothetical protein
MRKLENNTDLYEYLRSLADLLKGRSAAPLVEYLDTAARQATSLSTEFLGESQIALKKVLDTENGALTNTEREELRSVIKQIEFAVNR